MKKNEYSTYDLNIAGILVTMNFKMVKLDRENPKHVRFVFEDDLLIQEVIGNYWANKLSVDARSLLDAQKMLKTRIYNE